MKNLHFILLLITTLSSCSKNGSYIYHSDLNKPIGYTAMTTLIIKSDSACIYTGTEGYSDSCKCDWIDLNSNMELNYYKSNKVVSIDSFFYIKKGVRSKEILNQYTNRVVHFE